MKRLKIIVCAAFITVLLCGCGRGGDTSDLTSQPNKSSHHDTENESSENSAESSSVNSDITQTDSSDDEILSPNDPKRVFNKNIKLTEEQQKQVNELDSDSTYYPYAVASIYGYKDDSGHKLTLDDLKRITKEAEEKYPYSGAPESMTIDEKWDYVREQLNKRTTYIMDEIKKIQYFVDYVDRGKNTESAVYYPEVYSAKKPKYILSIGFATTFSYGYSMVDKDSNVTNIEGRNFEVEMVSEFKKLYGALPESQQRS